MVKCSHYSIYCGYSLFGKTVVFQTTLASSNLAIRFHEPLVEWLRHHTFTVVARVRFPYGLFDCLQHVIKYRRSFANVFSLTLMELSNSLLDDNLLNIVL